MTIRRWMAPGLAVVAALTASSVEAALTWQSQRSVAGGAGLWGVSVLDDDYAVAVGTKATVLRYDGSSWSTFPGAATPWNDAVDPDNSTPLRDVAVFSTDDIWVVSYGGGSSEDRGRAQWNGTTWGATDYGGLNLDRITAIWGTGPNLVVTARNNGRTSVWNGTEWDRPTSEGGSILTDVDGSGADNIWVVGTGNRILRSTDSGVSFPTLTSPVAAADHGWTGVSALSNEAVWLVGSTGTIAFWNGTDFALQASGTTQTLNAIKAMAADDVYAVGNNGTVLHFNGIEWSPVDLGFSVDDHLRNIDISPNGNVYIVGDNERILVGLVPEPASLGLMGVGLVAVLHRRR